MSQNIGSFSEYSKDFYAAILPYKSYCIPCWGQAGKKVIKPHESLFKQTLKMLDKKYFAILPLECIEKHHI